MDGSLSALRRMLDECARAVVFTGAGISTESGIPDFRSPGGLWSKNEPIDFDDFCNSEEMRRESWRRAFALEPTFKAARPNRGHRAVAELVKRGTAARVITQNIDGLHQASGIPDEKVIELHGNATFAKCLDCGTRHEIDLIRGEFLRTQQPPICDRCKGMVKLAVVSFGQPMPEEAMERAEAETLASDLFIAVGSSLVVQPAAGFPILAKRRGARLVILNREPTGLDAVADLALHLEIGPTLGEVVGVD